MGKNKEAVEMKETQAPENEEPKVVAALQINVLNNGALSVSIPEGMPELQSNDMEGISRQVYEQLRDMRIATTAIEMFKSRL